MGLRAWTAAAAASLGFGAALAGPIAVGHQGRLLDASGAAISGARDLSVTLYDGAGPGAAAIWTRTFADVAVADGFYALQLEAGTPALDASLFDRAEVWIAVAVDGGAELGPRSRLLSAPSAGVAHAVPVSTAPTCTGTGSIRWNPTAQTLEVCDDSAWVLVGGVGVRLVNGARQWADGSYAVSCEAYRNGVGGVYTGDTGDGVYRIQPVGASSPIDAHCDMTTDGGGWTLCYTESNGSVDFETQTSSAVAYGTDGYRADCRKIPFSEVLYVQHSTGNKAWFSRSGDVRIDAYPSSGSTWGLWTGHGAVSGSTWQLMACNTSMYVGLFASGYTGSCYKSCGSWCSDTSSAYFRVYGSSSYTGVAFNQNGHTTLGNQVMSVGIR
jgi:hypothetical protein